MGQNVFFDTCVYHQPGIDLLTKVVPVTTSCSRRRWSARCKGIDPKTGNYFDDTKRYVDSRTSRPPKNRRSSRATPSRSIRGSRTQIEKQARA